jgi:DNA-binding XRE family transcriptional regulator
MGSMKSRALIVARAQILARTGQGREIRKGAGLTQADIAPDVGVHKTAISQWERGAARPSGEHAIRWVRLLDKLEKFGAS